RARRDTSMSSKFALFMARGREAGRFACRQNNHPFEGRKNKSCGGPCQRKKKLHSHQFHVPAVYNQSDPMRAAKLIILCLALLCTTSLLRSSAQSSRTPSYQPGPTEKYKVVFSLDGSVNSFIDQLNLHSKEGYRLKSAVYGFQRFSGTYYNVPVAILESDETQFEYASFEATSRFYFVIPDFERKYAEESKNG